MVAGQPPSRNLSMAESEGIHRLLECKPVKGILVLDRGDGRIIEIHGNIFDGDQGKKYAKACRNIIWSITDNLREVEETESVSLAFPCRDYLLNEPP